jgi:hypoxanthine phosphoribosyltransferase
MEPTAETTTAPDVSDREVLGWLEFGEAARHLAADVAHSDFKPEVVIAIARGGLLLAGAIAYALDIKACGSLNVEFYTGIGEVLPKPVMLPPMLDEPSLAGKRVLLVDDVSDSGRTITMVVELLRAAGAEVQTVVLYTKPGTLHEPHFTWRRTSRWINFTWSTLHPVTAGL